MLIRKYSVAVYYPALFKLYGNDRAFTSIMPVRSICAALTLYMLVNKNNPVGAEARSQFRFKLINSMVPVQLAVSGSEYGPIPILPSSSFKMNDYVPQNVFGTTDISHRREFSHNVTVCRLNTCPLESRMLMTTVYGPEGLTPVLHNMFSEGAAPLVNSQLTPAGNAGLTEVIS